VHRQQLWNHLYELGTNGTTIFVTTHYMDEAERCTEVGFVREGQLLVKETPRRLKESFKSKLLELEVDPVMPALSALRGAPGVLDATLRSGHARIYAAEPERLLREWQREWPFPDFKWMSHAWVEPDMRMSSRLVARLHRTSRHERRMTIRSIWNPIASVAVKEFLHLWRDKRILALIIILPPFFTLLFGYAFEATELTGVHATIIDRDRTEQTAKLAELLGKRRPSVEDDQGHRLRSRLAASGRERGAGHPEGLDEHLGGRHSAALQLFLDGTDTTSAEELEGRLRETLGDFQGRTTCRS